MWNKQVLHNRSQPHSSWQPHLKIELVLSRQKGNRMFHAYFYKQTASALAMESEINIGQTEKKSCWLHGYTSHYLNAVNSFVLALIMCLCWKLPYEIALYECFEPINKYSLHKKSLLRYKIFLQGGLLGGLTASLLNFFPCWVINVTSCSTRVEGSPVVIV